MALGVQTQMGTRGSSAQKYLDSKNAFSQLKQQVSPMVEKGLISKSVSGTGTTSEQLLKGQIAYKKFELKEFSMLEQMIEERVHKIQETTNEQVNSAQVATLLAKLVSNNQEKEVLEDLTM